MTWLIPEELSARPVLSSVILSEVVVRKADGNAVEGSLPTVVKTELEKSLRDQLADQMSCLPEDDHLHHQRGRHCDRS